MGAGGLVCKVSWPATGGMARGYENVLE